MIERPFSEFLDDLAARTPVPGGGAASGFAACMGLALVRMVFRFGRPKTVDGSDPEAAAVAGRMDALDERLAALDQKVRQLAERDGAGFARVAAAYRLPKATDDERAVRSRAIQEALVGAMVVPEETLHLVRDCMEIALHDREAAGRNLAADLVNGAGLLLAAARGAWCNVSVNASYLHDRGRAGAAMDRAAVLMQEIHTAYDVVRRYGESLI